MYYLRIKPDHYSMKPIQNLKSELQFPTSRFHKSLVIKPTTKTAFYYVYSIISHHYCGANQIAICHHVFREFVANFGHFPYGSDI